MNQRVMIIAQQDKTYLVQQLYNLQNGRMNGTNELILLFFELKKVLQILMLKINYF
jgi:hypothetical protein